MLVGFHLNVFFIPAQALQMAPATMPEAVNPNIIVQQPLVSMSGVSHGDLDSAVVQTSAVSVVSTQQAHNSAVTTAAYVTTPMTDDGQVGWWCIAVYCLLYNHSVLVLCVFWVCIQKANFCSRDIDN